MSLPPLKSPYCTRYDAQISPVDYPMCYTGNTSATATTAIKATYLLTFIKQQSSLSTKCETLDSTDEIGKIR